MSIDKLLAALPYRLPLEPAILRDIPLVTWSGKPSPPYNGFTSVERLHLWQLIRWLEAQVIIAPLEQRDICGSEKRLQRHSENYYNPLQAAIVCGPCHRLIHLRFWRWGEWWALCRRHDPAGDKWYSMLEIQQPDIAGNLRAKHGLEAGNLKKSPIFELPVNVSMAFRAMTFQEEQTVSAEPQAHKATFV